MRLCRFRLDDLTLTGFYADDHVIPLEQAAEACAAAEDADLDLPPTEDLLPLLPPRGELFEAARTLSSWVDRLDPGRRGELALPIGAVKLLTPVAAPRKILLLAGNYAAHVVERGGAAPERAATFPYAFLKPPTTLTHPFDPIRLPRVSPGHIDWECELGVVIGAPCRGVAEADALDYVAGYTVVNDVSDRQFRPHPGRSPREKDPFFDWLHGKWHDTFCPVGPCLISADVVADPQALRLRLTVNGRLMQDGTTGQMVFPVAAIVSFLSQFVTLEPGDLISTGTPAGVGSARGTFLGPGDVVAATIDGIGTLQNPVVTADA